MQIAKQADWIMFDRNFDMKINEQLNKIEQNQNQWDITLSTTMVIVTLAGTIALPYLNGANSFIGWMINGFIGFACSGLFAVSIGRSLDKLVRTKWIKSYFIEDCGDVVKLHGSVRADLMGEAISDLLSTRAGLRIVDDSYSPYQCTLAAVPATAEEAKLKAFTEKNGSLNKLIS